ncbi:unnamed protein product [marine sediment metagenome]|uniref:Uncharacterized protein n=1 Tax=marine sediment metagenome TaxID=412755 RepID=X0ZY08_9ZZZZ
MSDIRHIVVRVTQEDFERIGQWKKKGESWESYIVGLVSLIETEVYGGVTD